jgi:hypothetical protein
VPVGRTFWIPSRLLLIGASEVWSIEGGREGEGSILASMEGEATIDMEEVRLLSI